MSRFRGRRRCCNRRIAFLLRSKANASTRRICWPLHHICNELLNNSSRNAFCFWISKLEIAVTQADMSISIYYRKAWWKNTWRWPASALFLTHVKLPDVLQAPARPSVCDLRIISLLKLHFPKCTIHATRAETRVFFPQSILIDVSNWRCLSSIADLAA